MDLVSPETHLRHAHCILDLGRLDVEAADDEHVSCSRRTIRATSLSVTASTAVPAPASPAPRHASAPSGSSCASAIFSWSTRARCIEPRERSRTTSSGDTGQRLALLPAVEYSAEYSARGERAC